MDYYFGNKDTHGALTLGKDELAHCLRVMRMQPGDRIGVLNGKGYLWEAEINLNTAKTGIVQIISETQKELPLSYQFHLVVAPTKSADRIEWLLEKAVETGITRFTLLYTQRTERKHSNLARLEKIAIAAMKQSGQLFLPVINESRFSDIIENCQSNSKYIASCLNFDTIQPLKVLKDAKDICVMVGPEGDFTPEEYEKAIHSGFQPISMGNQRFRTETAALLAVMSRFSFEN
ncbi:MAG: 16S rRNA (uracil(1498)-N(3))-methyltransferase [Bacteroidetes bacterium]|nr:16S rRNA (uracil(1498)-N(3))-methyltransferase [Bacteroidota bacterium]